MKKRACHWSRLTRSLYAALVNVLLVETIESFLENTVPFGEEICENLREADLSTDKYIRRLLSEIGDHHAAAIAGSLGLPLFVLVAWTQFRFVLALLPRFLHNVHDGSLLANVIAVAITFSLGYIASALNSIAVPEGETQAATIYALLFSSIAVTNYHWFREPYFLEMYLSLVLSLYAGGTTARGFRHAIRR